MGIFRLLILLALAWAIYWLVRRFQSRRRAMQRDARPEVGQMVRCEVCGLHVPESEAFGEGERRYCSLEHRRQAEE